jgi:hypothetical protein
MQRKCLCLFLLSFLTAQANAQENFKTLPLDDLSSFKTQAGNWRIVGDVLMDRSIDIHQPAPVPNETPRKSKKTKVPEEHPEAVKFSEGKGILLNLNDETKKDNIVTILEHGDIELRLEVMLPKGSNSGLFLQGRYEIQLFDSWGVEHPKFSDMGGIYRNWETDPDKIYMGKAPLSNAAKAPGLWQTLEISFRAPKFDGNGKKIENARFARVILNGVTIHENVEVPLLTGAPIENNEKATGPLMIQGDHGPVAIRNVKYKLLKELNYSLNNISYSVFHGNYKSTSDFVSAKPVLAGKTKDLSVNVVDVDNAYGLKLTGDLSVPEDARYLFTSVYSGGQKFTVNNQELFNHPTPDDYRRDTASLYLKSGTYPFEILNFKDASWMAPRLALMIQTQSSYPKALHSLHSSPPEDDPVSSIHINPGKDPKLIRAFIDYKGKRKDRLTHTIGVGDPSGLNYVYDLRSGNLVCVWRGDFVDATPMWHDRGDGSFRPLGTALYLTNNQALAYLNSGTDPFPTAAKEGELKSKGYIIQEGTNLPVFIYQYQDLEVEDKVFPDDINRVITHEVIIKKGTVKNGLYYKLAEGSSIIQMADGSFAINDKEYYIKPGKNIQASIREVNGKKELITTFSQSIQYSIIW